MKLEYDKKLLCNLFPIQENLSIYYRGSEEEKLSRMYEKIAKISAKKTQFEWDESPLHLQANMGSNCIHWQLLQSLVLMSKAKDVLEIGTFVGLSAIAMATVIGEKGKITTIEKFDEFAELAKNNFAKNNVSEKIELICGDAFIEIDKLKNRFFDFIYLDGNKEKYAEYFEMLDPLLISGGVFCVDDCFFSGDTLNDIPETEKGKGVQAFLDKIADKNNYNKMLLPIGNGVTVMVKE
jgi:predicted O-methyltransferase YrrM